MGFGFYQTLGNTLTKKVQAVVEAQRAFFLKLGKIRSVVVEEGCVGDKTHLLLAVIVKFTGTARLI